MCWLAHEEGLREADSLEVGVGDLDGSTENNEWGLRDYLVQQGDAYDPFGEGECGWRCE